MLTPQLIDSIHRLHAENKSTRQIARQLHLGRNTVARYLDNPVQQRAPAPRTSKLDPFKPAIGDWLE